MHNKPTKLKVNQFDPYITKNDISSVLSILKENWITEGKKTEEFQEILKKYCKVKHAILLPNGTLSLYIALMILGIGKGDEVIVPDFTFVGSATSIVLTGAKPVFADINLNDFNINISSLKSCITKRTKAIMPVHLYGQTAKMDEIMAIAKKHNLKVVEDAAQGIGVTFGKKHVGTFGDVGCISFYADKTITTAEGGAILTNSDILAKRCMYFKNQGRLKRGSFIHPFIGYNFRITDLQAALGVTQMKNLGFIIKRKLELEEKYKRLLKDVNEVSFPDPTKLGKRVPFRINILIDNPEKLGNFLQKRGIGTRRFFYPLHKQPCFNKQNCIKAVSYKNSEYVFRHGLSLPSGINLKERDVEYVCRYIKIFYKRTRI